MPSIDIKRSGSVGSKTLNTPRLFTRGLDVNAVARGTKDIANALTSISKEALDKRQQAIDTSYVTDSIVKSNEQIAKTKKSMFSEREDADGFANDFIIEADKVHQSFINNAPSPEAKQALQRNFASTRVSQYNSAFSDENKRLVADIQAKTEENINFISSKIFEEPESLEAVLDQADMLIDSTEGVLDKTNRDLFKKQSARKILSSYVLGLAEKGQIDEAEAVLTTDQVNKNFTTSEQKTLQTALDAKVVDIQRDTVKFEKGRIDGINSELLEREVDNELAVKDIMASNLPAKDKIFWLNRKKNIGASGPGNAILFNRTLDDIGNLTTEEIYNRADPELQTNPINGTQLTSLLKNKRGEMDSAVSTWSKGVKPTITGSTGLVKDPRGEAHFMEMQFEAEGLIKDAKTKGISPKEMFDPKGKHYNEYGGALLKKYTKSNRQLLNEMSESLKTSNDPVKKIDPSQRLNDLIKGIDNE